MAGTLHVVATPLGNLEDLSARALDTLRAVSCIACEDTRRTARLLGRHAIDTPTLSCHRFNEPQRLRSLVDRLLAGEDVALVSDGGTPAISDPGRLLVRAAVEAGVEVRPVPGPSAVVAILSVSGLPADRFVFDGFLPHRAGERRRRLRELRQETRTLVVFETPHRIREALDDIGAVLGARPVVLGRELTKIHETIVRGTPDQVCAALDPEPRGELVLAIGGFRGVSGTDATRADEILEIWRAALESSGGDTRGALKQAARRLGLKRAELYRSLAELGETTER